MDATGIVARQHRYDQLFDYMSSVMRETERLIGHNRASQIWDLLRWEVVDNYEQHNCMVHIIWKGRVYTTVQPLDGPFTGLAQELAAWFMLQLEGKPDDV